MQFKRWAVAALGAAIGISALPIRAGAQTTVLYNGAKDAGSDTPDSAAEGSWLEYTAGGGSPTVSSSGGATTLNTTVGNATPSPPAPPYSDEAGYSNYTPAGAMVNSPSPFPSLNPTPGFSVAFDVNVTSEFHSGTTRAGFDVIVLGSDKKGVELGFWENDVWAQEYSSGFTPDPSEDADTENGASFASTFSTAAATGNFHDYVLSIIGTNYSLTDDGATILTGQTHDYTASAMLPYTLANYVFIGDDTTEAAADESFSLLAVTVPEPATATGLLFVFSAALGRRRRSMI